MCVTWLVVTAMFTWKDVVNSKRCQS